MAQQDRDRDEAAIRALEAAYDAAWTAGDVEAAVACLTADAVIVTPRGEVVRGRSGMRRELDRLLRGPARGSKHRSRVLRVEFVTDDVAIVDGEAIVERMGGDEQAGNLTHAFADIALKRDGVWRIAQIRAYELRGLRDDGE